MDRLVFVLLLSGVYFVTMVTSEKIMVGYYGTWATYRNGLGRFTVDDVNTNLCSHMIYTFAGLDNQGAIVSLDPYLDLDSGLGNFRKFTKLKEKNPNLKTTLAVGGWNEGSAKFSTMAASPTLRQNFIQSALNILQEYNFDGLDLDWEYPNRRDTVHGAADVDNFTLLIKELKEQFDKYGLLLTAAVSSVAASASQSYDIPAISKHLDYIHLMTYDMYGAWDPVTGHNSPLHKGEGDTASREDLFTVDVAVEYWLSKGCPPEKLVLGMPLYGRTFTLSNPNNNGVRAPASGAGLAGPYTWTAGFMGYNEICEKLQSEAWDIRYDSLAMVPYAVQASNWISYDDVESLTKKVEYANSLNLAGGMVWSIETDDFHGTCGDGNFPLLSAINTALGRNNDDSITTQSTEKPITTSKEPTTEKPDEITDKPTTVEEPNTTEGAVTTESITNSKEDSEENISTDVSSTTEAPGTTSICKKEGFTINPESCTSFYICVSDVNGELQPKKFECPSATYWDQENLICNHKDQVQCHLDQI